MARVAVIGAGPCGLAACKTLKEFGLEFDCFEASDKVGGVWNIDVPGNGYRSLQTNTSTRTMAYSDYAFEENSPLHLTADQMVAYFSNYTVHFDLNQQIQFSSLVENIDLTKQGSWQVEIKGQQPKQYSSVIVATGRYAKKHLPHGEIKGGFSGEVLHSSDYFDLTSPINLQDKRVVVVGLGSSAVEIASDLIADSSKKAKQVVISTRSGRWVIPKIQNGKPADANAPHPSEPLPWLLSKLPSSLSTWLMRRVLGLVFRKQFKAQQNLLKTKLPEPAIAPWEDRPTLSADFIPNLQSEKIELKPGITEFDGHKVTFSDGSSVQADVIIYATGYRSDFPFLNKELVGADANNLPLYQQIAHPMHEGLFFIGQNPVLCSMWPLAEQQSRWIAHLLKGDFKLPAVKQRLHQAAKNNSTLPIICNIYVQQLRKEALKK